MILHSTTGCLLPSASKAHSGLILKEQVSNEGNEHLSLEDAELNVGLSSLYHIQYSKQRVCYYKFHKNTNKNYTHIQLLVLSPKQKKKVKFSE